MIDLSRFRDKCCYCFKGIEEELQRCSCDLTLCSDHKEEHLSKFGCNPMYVFKSGENKKAIVTDYEVHSEKEDLERRIQILIEHGVSSVEDLPECCHIYDINPLEKKIEGKAKCSKCEITNNLWICLECGNIGCGRVQQGLEGEGHALEHFHNCINGENSCQKSENEISDLKKPKIENTNNSQALHCHVAYIPSIDCRGAEQTFCYICDAFVKNPYKNKLTADKNIVEKFMEIQSTGKSQEESDPSRLVGIKNCGQTCYIASVLQLIGNSILGREDLSCHFSLCDSDPLECFCCQIVRIFNEIRNNTKEKNKIDISDFVRLVYKEMPEFEKGKQQDASEFLQRILDRLEVYEECMIIPKTTDVFEIQIETHTKCDKCNISSKSVDPSKMLFVPFKTDLFESIVEVFADTHLPCSCGGTLTITSTLNKFPERLLAVVKRYKFENNSSSKINSPVTANDLPVETLPLKESSNSFYRIESSICHSGVSLGSGHYTWWYSPKSENEEYFLVNDETVTKSQKNNSESGFIFCLELSN